MSPISKIAFVRDRLALLLSLSLSLTLAACGGGGGGAAPASVTIGASSTSVASGGALTLTWSSANTGASSCTASGAWSGSVATSGSQQVTAPTQTSGTATYTLTCGSTSNSTVVTVAQNSVAVTVDGGPDNNQFNVPYVSVTVCQPGTTVCKTIDHVMVDTGSYGLRLIPSASNGLAQLGLPAVTSSSGDLVGECGQFVSGYTWGAVLQADVKLGGETAAKQSIQMIGQAPSTGTTAPGDCSNTGSNLGTVASLGANGILGIGLFTQDCGTSCSTRAVSGTYYACSGSTCTSTTMPLAQQVSNPVAAFTTDNNGVILAMDSVGTGGKAALAGTLVFGIDTQSNNALGSATRYTANNNGYFTTTYKGARLTQSFIDSGSNGLFFNDSSITTCKTSTDFYCPGSPLSLSATTTGINGNAGSVSFTIEDVDTLGNSIVAAWAGGPYDTVNSSQSSGNSFDFGLPFFFGRKVYVGLQTTTASPYWAY